MPIELIVNRISGVTSGTQRQNGENSGFLIKVTIIIKGAVELKTSVVVH